MTLTSTSGYAQEAPELLVRYESLDAAAFLADVLAWFPSSPADILDIGAGTGRDAAYYASLGHRVVAVEPVQEMRDGAKHLHANAAVTWLADQLPDLAQVRAAGHRFDMVTLNSVWFHLTVEERAIGMGHIAELMRPGAHLFLTLRHGPVPPGRRMFPVGADATMSLAKSHGLREVFRADVESMQPQNSAAGVSWTKLVFTKPAP